MAEPRTAQRAIAVPDVGPDAWQDAADSVRAFAERVIDPERVLELRSVAELLDALARRGRHG